MKLLVIAAEVPDPALVREAVGAEDAEVYVVAPALEDSAVRFWVSDVDDAIARARAVEQQAVSRLREARIPAAGAVGEAEPLQAARDALVRFPADRILILTHDDDQRAYREQEIDAAREEFGVPVEIRQVARTSPS